MIQFRCQPGGKIEDGTWILFLFFPLLVLLAIILLPIALTRSLDDEQEHSKEFRKVVLSYLLVAAIIVGAAVIAAVL